ncbi:GTP cyclohydrolase II [Azohydromonas caseinilytica]|uniref:GTP cyclohydrolase-2 n=1 Tax=Azohydromonas caseinilytica TaxID=2728836 RepID=A0A848FCS9_9BURK|nr:GTP cyclohydrolase II [Azohydromonas caseinilytica]NML17112.1 GTP cyclohydrolase II [Azohydromonas caseinilytica]
MKSDSPDCLQPCVERGPSARLPTPHGEFILETWFDRSAGVEHLAIRKGELAGAQGVLARVHSECLTGDLLGSLRCDCGPQLQLALARIAEAGQGVVVYMRGHEGRGIGLAQKLRAYALQDQGLDTVDANVALGHPVDARRYEAAAAILKQLGVRSIRLMSNNPLKLLALREQGIDIVERERHEAGAHPQNSGYLATKRERLGHLLQEAGVAMPAAPAEAAPLPLSGEALAG